MACRSKSASHLEELCCLGEVGILEYSPVDIRSQIHQHLHAHPIIFGVDLAQSCAVCAPRNFVAIELQDQIPQREQLGTDCSVHTRKTFSPGPWQFHLRCSFLVLFRMGSMSVSPADLPFKKRDKLCPREYGMPQYQETCIGITRRRLQDRTLHGQ